MTGDIPKLMPLPCRRVKVLIPPSLLLDCLRDAAEWIEKVDVTFEAGSPVGITFEWRNDRLCVASFTQHSPARCGCSKCHSDTPVLALTLICMVTWTGTQVESWWTWC